ncbi:MAG: polysaccharide export protein [Acidobacteria bacterium]|nr:polysaccharide export protein [Acidobacteriota bacterium]
MKMSTIRSIFVPPAMVGLLLANTASIFGGQARSGGIETTPPQRITGGNSKPSGELEADRPKLQKRAWRYRLRPGDVLELTFPLTPEFDQKVTVQPDGYITLRGVGEVRAEGQTVPELTRALQTAYAKILHDPVISVDLKEFEKPYFIVGGEVWRPGKFELRSDTTASAAIAIAGSFRESAKHSQVLLIRPVSGRWAEVKVLNFKKMLQTRNLREDPHLQPGDMLFVPKNALSKVKPFIPIPGVGFSFYPGAF